MKAKSIITILLIILVGLLAIILVMLRKNNSKPSYQFQEGTPAIVGERPLENDQEVDLPKEDDPSVQGLQDELDTTDQQENMDDDEVQYYITSSSSGNLVSSRPGSGSIVPQTFELRGTMTGAYFFEGSFPINVYDAEGNSLQGTYATATGDWMTTGPVGFVTTINVGDYSGPISIVFRADDPSDGESGRPARAESIAMTVLDENGEVSVNQTVDVYFVQRLSLAESATNPNLCHNGLVRRTRAIAPTQAVATASLNELIEGPTLAESQDGLRSAVPSNAEIVDIAIVQGVATVKMSGIVFIGDESSCAAKNLREQITQTLLQFPTIYSVNIISADTPNV